MGPFLLLHTALAADCTLHRVVPADIHALATRSGMPRNTLVLRSGACPGGATVQVLSTDPLYATDNAVAPACVPEAELASIRGLSWVVPAPWNTDDPRSYPQPAGTILDPLPSSLACDAAQLPFGDQSIDRTTLGPLRPIEPELLASVRAVHAHASERFGPIAITAIAWTHTGRVSLPWVHWDTDAELADTLAREHLETRSQQERAVRARGPSDHYLYFKGSDPIRSDIWGTPPTIHALIDALADWKTTCPTDPTHCVVQLGDISWYSDKRPDPLGHRDHYGGTCIDIRLFRADGSRYEAWWNRPDDRPHFGESAGYDGTLTAAFIAHLRARTDVQRVLFNDPSAPDATPARGHDDHMHVCFEEPPAAPPPPRTPSALD